MKRQVKQLLGLSAFAAGCMAVGMGLSYRWVAQAQEEHPVVVEAKELDRLPPIAEVAEKLNPTVVAITSTSYVKARNHRRPDGPMGDNFFDFFFGPGHPQIPRGHGGDEEQRIPSGGSGVVISADGEILTNHHVIEGVRGASDTSIEVKTSDGKTFKATVLGKDKELDIAVIKIDAHHLPFAKLGDSDAMRIGEWVVAIGNPLGLEHTVTQGIVSAKGRKLMGGLESFLQTDAAINRGNSGGPLLNLRGEVIGINTMIRADGQNIGFAVPVNQVKRVYSDLKSGKPVRRGLLGISSRPLDEVFQQSLGVKEGVVVDDVTKGQAADKAGVRRLDVVTHVDGTAIRNPDDLVLAVSSRRAGETIKLTLVRDGKTLNFSVVLGDRKDLEANLEGDAEEETRPEGSPEGSKSFNLEKSYGFSVEALNPTNRHQFRVAEDRQGVVITSVLPRSAAAEGNLQVGFVISAVGTTSIKNLQEFTAQVKKASGKPLLLLVQTPRGKGQFTAAIPPR